MRVVRNIVRMCVLCFALLFGCKPHSDTASSVSIAQLRSCYKGYPSRITQPWYIEGLVTSCDLDGNFYKTIVVEDSYGAVEFNIDNTTLYNDIPWCSRVRIFVEGLWIGAYGRTIVIGGEPNDYQEVANIAWRDFTLRLQSLAPSDSLYQPPTKQVGELNLKDVQHWLRIERVQFIDSELGQSWGVADSTTRRHLVSAQGDTLPVATSAYARWRDTKIPSGSGTIDGIIYYRRGAFEIHPISSVRVNMDKRRFTPQTQN